MAKKVKRAWFVDTVSADEKVGIVEKTSRTVDGITDEWQAVKETGLRVFIEYSAIEQDYTNISSNWANINPRYRDVIINRAISMGYRDPRNLNLQNAEYFETAYKEGLKKAKKFAKSGYVSTGKIVPQDF
jgi:hypothetical protein